MTRGMRVDALARGIRLNFAGFLPCSALFKVSASCGSRDAGFWTRDIRNVFLRKFDDHLSISRKKFSWAQISVRVRVRVRVEASFGKWNVGKDIAKSDIFVTTRQRAQRCPRVLKGLAFLRLFC